MPLLRNIFSFTPLVYLILLSNTAIASENIPLIFSCTPQYLQQGQITTSVVTGQNLNSTVVGVSGGDVYALILKQDPNGMSLTIQFATKPTSEPGERELYLKNANDVVAKYYLKITPRSIPIIDNVSPSVLTPGTTSLLYLTGMDLTNSIVSTTANGVSINSSRNSPDGNVIYTSVSVSKDTAPGTYQFYITSAGGQAQANFTIAPTPNNDDSLLDPYSPGIFSIQKNPSNVNELILRGSMFDIDPSRNTVTVFENNNGILTGRQLEIVSSSQNEIIVNLPNGLKGDSLSFAVSSVDGRSSNIKSFELNLPSSNETANNQDQENIPLKPTQENSPQIAHNNQPSNNNNNNDVSLINNNPSSNSNPSSNNTHHEEPITTQNTQSNTNAITTNKNIDLLEGLSQNIKNLNQYLFSNDLNTENKTDSKTNLSQLNDPKKLISAIEEEKQMRNQADVIMIALNEAKNNQELSNAAKKAENLKLKIDELEKVIELEKQKNKPNQKKLIVYQKLLENANAESRSQTFALLNNLLKYKPQLKNLLSQKPFDLAAIQPNIPNNTAIIQYVPTEEGLIIFVVDNKNLKTRINKLVTRASLNKQIQDYRQLFEKEIEKINTTGRVTSISSWKDDKSLSYKKNILPIKEKNDALYKALISPIEKDIANKKVIAIISNGWLNYLPFQSLGKLQPDGDLKFLISDKSIVSLDSAIAINKTALSPISAMSSITIIANPDGTLPGANKEAEVIKSIYTSSSKSYIQKPISLAGINQLSKKSDILHLATHGFLDGTDINASFLVTGKKSQRLLLKDIYDLNLENNKLVVLSGCDTGKIGSLLNEPDDIVGSLASAFRVAGSNTILASLWQAHDEATKIIMQNFYENLKLGYDKAESLRRAELKLKETPKYSHPLFWSLFSLIGDWR